MANWFWNTGILQFGYFVTRNKVTPVRFCPEYLPAYPQLLAEGANLTVAKLDTSEIDHLIVTADSVPLGVACSLQTNLSLAYSRGRGEAAVYDLVGSYNSSHMSALIVNCVDDAASIEKFISNARNVGLETQLIVQLIEMRSVEKLAGLSVISVFRLADFVKELIISGRLTQGQAQVTLNWIYDEQE